MTFVFAVFLLSLLVITSLAIVRTKAEIIGKTSTNVIISPTMIEASLRRLPKRATRRSCDG